MATALNAKKHDIGGMYVKRLLPHATHYMVGPYIFLDEMGPGKFEQGQGLDVRPHPHIGLSTLTYLFDGALLHRDSLGNNVEIKPGEVNWMTAGRGIVHSERESIEVRATEHGMYGLQCWVALPEELSDIEPSFVHMARESLPEKVVERAVIRVVVGSGFGLQSPVPTYWPMVFADVIAQQDATLALDDCHEETAFYVQYGKVQVSGDVFGEGQFVVLDRNEDALHFLEASRIIVVGGKKFSRQPYIYWNFVAFTKDKIEQAKANWRAGQFPKIDNDNVEYIPLPD